MMNHDLKIDLADLYGEWFILYSNFPMWTSGKRASPSLNYSLRDGQSEYKINDIVKYTSNGQHKTIKGYDRVLSTSYKFEWKGKGLLSLLKSRWEIVHFDKDWMIIYFEKTMFTPKGYDLVSKVQHPDGHTIEKMKAKLEELEINDLSKISQ